MGVVAKFPEVGPFEREQPAPELSNGHNTAAVNKDIDPILKEAGMVLPVLTTVDDRAKVEKFYQDQQNQQAL